MWIELLVRVGQEPIGISVMQLDEPSRARVAASLAWIRLGEQRPADGMTPAAWAECLEDVLAEHVRLTIPEERLAGLDPAWWSEAVSQALLELVRTNGLMPQIQQQFEALRRLERSPKNES